MESSDGRHKSKERHTSTPRQILRQRQRSKTLSSVTKEDIIQWLQEIKISELYRYRRSS